MEKLLAIKDKPDYQECCENYAHAQRSLLPPFQGGRCLIGSAHH
jgi:hypothetical protein